MKKPYFTKYLPVEGKPEIGDTYQILSVGLPGWEGYPKWGNLHIFTGNIQDKLSRLMPEGHVRKVKLFLCNRDIQVGDKVRYIEEYLEEFNCNEQDLKSRDEEELAIFKVIGEISPEALSYVKEDDEFDENEVELVISKKPQCICAVTGVYRSEAQQVCSFMVDDYRGGDYCNRQINFVEVVKIKGPCGHFH